MHIVMTGYDVSVFEASAASDTRRRLSDYAARLQQKNPAAQLTYCVLGASASAQPVTENGLSILPLAGRGMGLHLKLLNTLSLLHKQNPISTLAAQSPYLDGLICWLFARCHGLRFMVQVHNDPFTPPRRFAARLKAQLAFFLLRRAETIRCVNPVLTHKMAALWPHTRCTFIPVPVLMTPQPRATQPDTPLILCVSRLSPEKGVDVLLDAVAKALPHIPSLNVMIAGDGPARLALQAQAKALGIDNAVTFLGAVPHTDLSALYQQASVLALTSHEEGLGRVIIEAFLHGVPVVATATSGARALLSNTHAGLLCPIADAAALATALTTLCNDNALNTSMGQAALIEGTKFDASALAEAWVECLAEPSRQTSLAHGAS
jgi:glycosyltransferase involved in cell wall biosynthesis